MGYKYRLDVLATEIAEAETRQAEKLAAFEQARAAGTLAELMADTPSVMDRARERGYGKYRAGGPGRRDLVTPTSPT